MFQILRSRLGWKLFLSYVLVIAVGILVIALTTNYIAPRTFDSHMLAMEEMMEGGRMPGGMMSSGETGYSSLLNQDLADTFKVTINETLVFSALSAFLVALVISILIANRIVSPIRQMMTASQRIAEGHYDERVESPSSNLTAPPDELGQLAASFNQMAESLEKNEDLRRQLIGDVAHELRTPLTTIKGSMEGLIDGVLPPTHETYQQIHREADRLQKLVKDLQELSRVEAGAYELHLEPSNLGAIIQATNKRLEQQYQEKGVFLIDKIPPDLPQVLADEDRIGQVLINLVGNAIQYTPPGGRVSIEAVAEDNNVVVSVVDNGSGIEAEHLPHIFTRFYRVDKSRSRAGGGSGIGLTISKHLIEAHGGRIWVESGGLGKGSKFSFALPVFT